MGQAVNWSRHEEARALARRNRRTAWILVGWIALLLTLSIIVIWIRN
jgi:hypothetical protein